MIDSKRKIGILTFHHAASYGAVLQCFALYSTLTKLVAPQDEVGIIDLVPTIFSKNTGTPEMERFVKFSQANLKMLTAEKSTLQDCLANVLVPDQPVTDAVVGSDQVWNPRIIKESLKDYFLYGELSGIRKYAYAASFGVNELPVTAEQEKIITEALADFDKISVREPGAVTLCKRFQCNNAVSVLDPTLLADPQIYEKFVNPELNKSCVCGFFLAQASYQSKILKKLSKKLKNPALFIGRKAPFLSFIKSAQQPPVEEFLSTLHNAAGVVTDSFHGVCFSIIFKRQFIVLPSHRKERFVRIGELLQKLGLSDRVIDDYNDQKACKIMQTPIDYTKVDALLVKYRSESQKFLEECFQPESNI